MRVLVTGHEGYIGGLLVPLLQQAGYDVVGCDVGFFRSCTFNHPPVDIANLSMDVRDLAQADLSRFDAVIHLAGLSNDPLGQFDPHLTTEINEQASIALAERARSQGVQRFLFASSCSNYGASTGALLDESAPFNPQTEYGVSKVNAEQAISALGSDQFCVTHLRAGTVYGVAPRMRFDLVVNNLMAYAMDSGKIVLKSDGSAWRPLVHAEDVARAYVAILQAPVNQVMGEAFNVGRNEDNVQIKTVAQMIQAALPGTPIEMQPNAPTDTRNYRVNCDKLVRHVSGYRPRWTLTKGIEQLKAALSQQPISVAHFEGARFSRLAHLRHRIDEGDVSLDLRCVKVQ